MRRTRAYTVRRAPAPSLPAPVASPFAARPALFRRLAGAGSALAAAALLAAGCGQPEAPLQGGEPSNSPSASQVAVPTLAAAGNAHTTAGATEYTRYWFATLTYAVQTGDTKKLSAASDVASCTTCRKAIELVRTNYSDGGRMQGGAYTLQNVMAFENFAGNVVSVAVTFDRSPRSGFSPLGVSRDPLDGASFAECDLRLVWTEGGWRVRAVEAGVPIA